MPLPRIDSTLDSFAGVKLFTMLDFASEYWQVEIEPVGKQKTELLTHKGTLNLSSCLLDLRTNAPSTFQ